MWNSASPRLWSRFATRCSHPTDPASIRAQAFSCFNAIRAALLARCTCLITSECPRRASDAIRAASRTSSIASRSDDADRTRSNAFSTANLEGEWSVTQKVCLFGKPLPTAPVKVQTRALLLDVLGDRTSNWMRCRGESPEIPASNAPSEPRPLVYRWTAQMSLKCPHCCPRAWLRSAHLTSAGGGKSRAWLLVAIRSEPRFTPVLL